MALIYLEVNDPREYDKEEDEEEYDEEETGDLNLSS